MVATDRFSGFQPGVLYAWPITLLLLSAAPAAAVELGLPAACTLGEDCFVQQFPDVNPAKDTAQDPFCGGATYDGHSGLDLRILSMKDVGRGVPVAAMADGKVLRSRDGEPDRLVMSQADREAVQNKECGNGMVVDHGDGVEVQYCHMKQGSLAVKPGDMVKRGDRLGDVGASGMAQFPHVHVTIRKGGVEMDGSSGKALADGCAAGASTTASLYEPGLAEKLGHGETAFLAAGLAGSPIDHNALTLEGPPATATTTSQATITWAWFINMRGGDQIGFKLTDASGTTVFERTGEAIDRNKATYSAFVGKKGAPKPGAYTVEISLIRDGKPILEKSLPVIVN